MAVIRSSFGSGGANLAPGGAAGTPTLAEVLGDVADDLAALQPAAIVAPEAGAVYGPAEQALLNELRQTINALAAVVLRTRRDDGGEGEPF
jgi:hypothetical protein